MKYKFCNNHINVTKYDVTFATKGSFNSFATKGSFNSYPLWLRHFLTGMSLSKLKIKSMEGYFVNIKTVLLTAFLWQNMYA